MGCKGSKPATVPESAGATKAAAVPEPATTDKPATVPKPAGTLLEETKELVSVTGKGQEAAAATKAAATPAPAAQSSEDAAVAHARFVVGQQVECRDPSSFSGGLAAWKPGTVTCISPLRVSRDGHHCFAYEWGEVRPLQERFAVGQRVECRDPLSHSEGLASWKLGTVTCTSPLQVTRDGHHSFAYEWGEVRLSQVPAAGDGKPREPSAEPGISSVVEMEAPTGASKKGAGFDCLHFCRTTEAETEIVVDHDAADGRRSPSSESA